MRPFIKYFVIAFFAQLVLLTPMFFIERTRGIAEFIVYTFYIFPYTYILPQEPDKRIEAAGYTFYLLLIIPPVIYSVIISLILCGLSRVKHMYK